MGVAAQSAGNRAMTGPWDNQRYVNSLWYSYIQIYRNYYNFVT